MKETISDGAVEEVQQSKEGRHRAQGGVLFWMGARGGWSEARRTRRSWWRTFDRGAMGTSLRTSRGRKEAGVVGGGGFGGGRGPGTAHPHQARQLPL